MVKFFKMVVFGKDTLPKTTILKNFATRTKLHNTKCSKKEIYAKYLKIGVRASFP